MNRTELKLFLDGHGGEYEYAFDVPASEITSFRCGGNAEAVIYPNGEGALCALLRFLSDAEIKYCVLGCGTNVLIDDAGYDGVIVITTKLTELKIDGETLRSECGRGITSCASAAQKAGLSGLSFAYGIPGSVGGAVTMNAGAYGGEISDVIVSADCWDADAQKIVTLTRDDLSLGYRDSAVKRGGLYVLSALFALHRGDHDAILAEMNDFMERRRDKQPLSYPSAGSFFKRAPGHFTGKLIEDAGLKGLRVGGAMVSEKHAGFIINAGGASAGDVKKLAEIVMARVLESSGVALEREIIYL